MGNCQAVDAAALVVQHPSGRLERMYWPITASQVIKANPGHRVSLIIPLPPQQDSGHENNNKNRTVRLKLLRPTDVLVLGRAYRLITTQEVMNVLRAKKHAKTKKNQSESGRDLQMDSKKQSVDPKTEGGVSDRHRLRSTNLGSGRIRLWRPSLQSITEGGSGIH